MNAPPLETHDCQCTVPKELPPPQIEYVQGPPRYVKVPAPPIYKVREVSVPGSVEIQEKIVPVEVEEIHWTPVPKYVEVEVEKVIPLVQCSTLSQIKEVVVEVPVEHIYHKKNITRKYVDVITEVRETQIERQKVKKTIKVVKEVPKIVEKVVVKELVLKKEKVVVPPVEMPVIPETQISKKEVVTRTE